MNRITFTLNLTSVSLITLSAFYGISCFYAVDSGMGFVGFLKFLPVVLYMLVLMQEKDCKERIIERLPYTAFVVFVISFVLMFVPVIKSYLVVAGRMAGCFQYPNTFALFLLTGELVLMSKKKIAIPDAVVIAGLIFGIICTGSRLVFVLSVISNLFMVFFEKTKKTKIIVSAVLVVCIGAVVLLYPVLSDSALFGRFFTISVFESTFVGRILYFVDAIPLALRHPFGMGYLGYNYTYPSVQTGVYTVRYVHNDFMQIILDVGIIPCLLVVGAVIKSLFAKSTENWKKIILSVIFIHSCLDFNLQFIAMFFIFILFLDFENGKEYTYKKHVINWMSLGALGLISLYFGAALGLSYFGAVRMSEKMFSANTENSIALISAEDDIVKANEIADRTLARNKYVRAAYDIKAGYSYSMGDFEKLIYYKNEQLKIAPFAVEEYIEYCYMLINGMLLYEQAGDIQSAIICRAEFFNTYDRIQKLPEKLSSLGGMIDDQPDVRIPEDMVYFASELEGVS